jgi:CubicO group peptidase (beta-lactamase class C family)
LLPNTEAEEQNGWRQEGARYVSTKRSTSSAASRGGLRGVDPRSIAVAGVLILSAALSLLLAGCTDEPRRLVMDDFESRELADWRTVSGGAGGWFVYTDGQKAPDPAHSDPNVPFDLPNPPQGTHAAVTDMNGPGTRILYRDVTLDGRLRLHMRVFYAGGDFSSPDTLAYDAPEANQQFRIDLVRRSAPIDSVAKGDVLVNVFQTSAGDPGRREPTPVSVDVSRWAGQTVRLRLAGVDNRGPLRAGVDDIRFAPIDSGADAGIELPDTPVASRALNLVLHRLTEADALTALSDRAAELAREGEFSGALLVARDGKDLLRKAWGLENREVGTRNTPDTRFRIGSMNKMFTAVATLQLVEEGKLALDDTVGKHLREYPNKDVASKVTVRHLLTHTGGTGDVFGPEFDLNRLKLREHRDYVKLYGSRGLTHEPGARHEYSNYGFVLLGALIERVSSMSYYDYVREKVFQPAGMASTDSLPESEKVARRAVGYTRALNGAWEANTEFLPWRGTSAGGGYSTVGDLLRFAQALESGKLISKETLVEATQAHEQQYGYGFGVQGEGSLRSYGHGGGAPGMNGELRVFPQLGYVVVGLGNLDPPAASGLVEYFALRMPDR